MLSVVAFASLFASLSLVSATPSFPSALQDGLSCARSISQVSCHSSYAVDPSSYGTCCFNGALKAGSEESGLVLATQFWNLTTGPQDSWTIHGLWPDYCSGRYPAFCSTDSGIPEKDGGQIEEALQEYDPALLAYMRTYYENDPSFWEHEYNKHGTCFSTLRGKCQVVPLVGAHGVANQTTTALVGYFGQIVRQFKQLPTYEWLRQAGITPSADKTYKLHDIQQALSKHFDGFTPYVGCSSKTQLSEVWYYYNVRGPLIHGQYIPVNTTSPSSCQEDVQYLPK